MVDFTEEDYSNLERLRKEQSKDEWKPIPLYLELTVPPYQHLDQEKMNSEDMSENIVIIQL